MSIYSARPHVVCMNSRCDRFRVVFSMRGRSHPCLTCGEPLKTARPADYPTPHDNQQPVPYTERAGSAIAVGASEGDTCGTSSALGGI
jgi:hypothetical protein